MHYNTPTSTTTTTKLATKASNKKDSNSNNNKGVSVQNTFTPNTRVNGMNEHVNAGEEIIDNEGNGVQ